MVKNLSRKSVTCDYCDKMLSCDRGSPLDRGYWQSQIGLRVCDDCLLQHCDDFPLRPDRLFTLRLLHVRGINIEAVEGVFNKARNVLVADQVDCAAGDMRDALELFHVGERLAAMEKAQAVWNTANHLNDLMTNTATSAGRRVRQGGRKGAEASKATRNGASSKRARILAEAAKYSGSEKAKVATIANRTGSTGKYVREVLRKREL